MEAAIRELKTIFFYLRDKVIQGSFNKAAIISQVSDRFDNGYGIR